MNPGALPPYASKVNGYANGDMLYDHFKARGKEPSEADWVKLQEYVRAWRIFQQLSKPV